MWKTMMTAAVFAASVIASVGPAAAFGPGGLARSLSSHPSVEYILADREVQPPLSRARICAGTSIACKAERPVTMVLTSFRFAQLKRVNDEVNFSLDVSFPTASLGPITISAGEEVFDAPAVKRAKLIALGWKKDALSFKSVRTRFGTSHQVLVVKTSKGEFALDHRTNTIRPWVAKAFAPAKAPRPFAL